MAVEKPNAVQLAKFMHETYEEWAPSYGWETQERSRTVWASVPKANRDLMVAVAAAVIMRYMTAEMSTLSDKPDAVRAREYKQRKKEGLVQSQRSSEERV